MFGGAKVFYHNQKKSPNLLPDFFYGFKVNKNKQPL